MPITEADAAKALMYLTGANANVPKDGQAAVWANYLNDPDVGTRCTPEQFVAATKRAIKTWDLEGRYGQINVNQIVREVRKLRAELVTAAGGADSVQAPRELGDDPKRANEWKRRVLARIGDGLPVEVAAAQVNAAASITPAPRGELKPPPKDLAAQIRRLAARDSA